MWALTFGVVAIVNLGWYLMVPIGRRSFFLELSGVSWEYAIKWHRWMGGYTFLLLMLHGIMYLVVWMHGNGHRDFDPEGTMLARNLWIRGCDTGCDNEQAVLLRQNIYGLVALAAALIMVCTSLGVVRRRFYELFYYTHHLFVVVLLFTCLHYKRGIIYLFPGLAIYVVDKTCRLLAYSGGVDAHVNLVSPDIVEVRVRLGAATKYKAGQYIFLNAPAISVLQWHPFSLTSSPKECGGGAITFHVKALGGPTSWTSALVSAARASKDHTLKLKIDGFYGHAAAEKLCGAPTALSEAPRKAIVLVGGGVGVTPLLSIMADACVRPNTARVVLLWCTRTYDEFTAFAPRLLEAKMEYGERLEIHVAITRHPNAASGSTKEDGRVSSDPIGDLAARRAKPKPQWPEAMQPDTPKSNPAKNPSKCKMFSSTWRDRTAVGFVPVVPSLAWFTLVSLVSLIVMTVLWSEIESRSDEIGLEGTRIWGLVVSVGAGVTVALVLILIVADNLRAGKRGSSEVSLSVRDNYCEHAEEEAQRMDPLHLEFLIRGFIANRVGKRLDLCSIFDELSEQLAVTVDEVGVVACGAAGMIEQSRKECERLNGSECSDDRFWKFEEECWDW